MSNQSIVVPAAGGVAAPPIDLNALNPAELRDLCKGMFSDLSFLAGAVPSQLTSMLSTGVTAAAAVTAGAIDGYLGEKSNLGPVGLSAAIAGGMAVLAVFTKNPDYREGAAAVARGFGAPVLYEASKRRVQSWKSEPKEPKELKTKEPKPVAPKEPSKGIA